MLIRMLGDVEDYGYHKGDIVDAPQETGSLLIKHNLAVEVKRAYQATNPKANQALEESRRRDEPKEYPHNT